MGPIRRCCERPAVTTRGTKSYCALCWARLLGTFDPSSFPITKAVGVPVDDEPMYMLRCCRCGAGWCGPLLDPCAWCATEHQVLIAHQHDVTLTPPEEISEARLNAWAARLDRAIEAEIIDRTEADVVWRRAVGAHVG